MRWLIHYDYVTWFSTNYPITGRFSYAGDPLTAFEVINEHPVVWLARQAESFSNWQRHIEVHKTNKGPHYLGSEASDRHDKVHRVYLTLEVPKLMNEAQLEVFS